MSLPHVCLYVCSCVHGTAETLDGVEEWLDTQTSQQTDVNETYYYVTFLAPLFLSDGTTSYQY